MIAFLKGILESRFESGCWVDVNGVGYEVFLGARDLEKLPAVGEAVNLYTCLIKREEDDRLFGFISQADRRLFKVLIGVSNIGPKLAMAVLSGLTQSQLEQAVSEQNVDLLVRVPGIGKKTAERLLLELKDKLDLVKISPLRPSADEQGAYAEALEALATLGYSRTQARLALQKVADQKPSARQPGEDAVADLVRQALKYV